MLNGHNDIIKYKAEPAEMPFPQSLFTDSRLLLGTAQYPSPTLMQQAIAKAQPAMVTVSLRRQGSIEGGAEFWQMVKQTGVPVLPNTAGCRSAKEAITVAQMSREVFATELIKLEITGDDYNLQPDPFALLEATTELINQGFKVLPYSTDDLVLCQRLVEAGCQVVMPWGAPIGSGKGLLNPYALKTLRARLPDVFLIIDAGIGSPSHACQAMELGFDAVLLNTAVSQAADPVLMAGAFSQAVAAGRAAYLAGQMQSRETASPSTPVLGTPFWQQS